MNQILKFGRSILALILMVFFMGPIYWLINTSLKSPIELLGDNVQIFPKSFYWGNYSDALEKSGIIRAFLNSIFVSLTSTLLIILLIAAPAYYFARRKNKITQTMSMWILISQVFPVSLIIIPMFLTLQRFNLINTTWGLILVYVVINTPFSLWLLRSFIVTVPFEIEEAAAIDGANLFQILWRVLFPLLVPGFVVVAIFTFINVWNEFFFALVLLSDPEKSTLPLKLAQFVGSEGRALIGTLSAATVISTIPAFLMYAVIQKKFSENLVSGAVKG
jgi:multiple sugar transport system permease protein